MINNLDKYEILLASNSPRRRELLAGLEIKYEVTSIPDVDESFPQGLSMEEIPQYIAKQKALAYLHHMNDDTLLITADTIVWSEGKVLGKPSDSKEAYEMIASLSGKTHSVVTGVFIQTKQKSVCFSSVTKVTFDTLSAEEIQHYVDKYKPMDKAGSYGIQEWIGFVGVKSIEGSYFNVMGLPVQRLYKELQSF